MKIYRVKVIYEFECYGHDEDEAWRNAQEHLETVGGSELMAHVDVFEEEYDVY